jgi:hypothetical protein
VGDGIVVGEKETLFGQLGQVGIAGSSIEVLCRSALGSRSI